ncbi:MAG: hypothetical protein HY225_03255 [Candidatus Vogelbacteria bacterium]|nr:hypothetical protein [Candidatus Vogelbacteria bacterium]
MRGFIFLVVVLLLSNFTRVGAHGNFAKPPMNNFSIPMINVTRHDTSCVPKPGLYWSQPYQYPLVPLYVQPLVQPQEMIMVDMVKAEGVDLRYGHYRQVQYQIGGCSGGLIWCKAGVTAGRFQAKDEAYRFVEQMFSLIQGSLRELDRHINSSPWYIN